MSVVKHCSLAASRKETGFQMVNKYARQQLMHFLSRGAYLHILDLEAESSDVRKGRKEGRKVYSSLAASKADRME